MHYQPIEQKTSDDTRRHPESQRNYQVGKEELSENYLYNLAGISAGPGAQRHHLQLPKQPRTIGEQGRSLPSTPLIVPDRRMKGARSEPGADVV